MKNNEELITGQPDIKKLIYRFYSFRKLYIITIGLFLVLAFLKNKTATPVYKNSATILIKDNNQSILNMGNTNQGLMFRGAYNTVEDRLAILSSFQLTKKAVQAFDHKVSYFVKERKMPFKFLSGFDIEKELYKNSPVEVNLDFSKPQLIWTEYHIEFINEDEFRLVINAKEAVSYNYIDEKQVNFFRDISLSEIYRYGELISNDYFSFIVEKTPVFGSFDKDNDDDFYFTLYDYDYMTVYVLGSLQVKRNSQTSNIVEVSLSGTNFHKVTDFLNVIINVYIDQNLDQKNRIAQSTTRFIDSQISAIADSLSTAETTLKNFRSSQQITDLSYQGQRLIEQINTLEDQRAAIQMQSKYYTYLKNYLSENEERDAVTNLVVPAAMNAMDPLLTALVTEIVSLSSQRINIIRTSGTTQKNIYLADLDIKIDNLRKTILENVENGLNNIQINENEINYRLNNLNAEVAKLPRKELQLLGIERKFDLNNEIYNYLLERRTEAEIARASNQPDYEIIEDAKFLIPNKISPNTKLNLIIALVLGLFFPTGAILIYDFFNNKIREKDDIGPLLANVPFLGFITHNYRKSLKVVQEHPNSSFTESFRELRTNLQFFSATSNKQVILVTSSYSGEGKSYISLNLANIFAINNMRTVFVEFDLRKPFVSNNFQTGQYGLASYLINKANIDDIINHTDIPNLDFISSDAPVPNPAELVSSERTVRLIEHLKSVYDCVIIDSTPVGIFSETYLLMKHADINVFIARLNFTLKDKFLSTIENIQANKISNLAIVLNDLDKKLDKTKYGYYHKYFVSDEEPTYYERFKKFIKK